MKTSSSTVLLALAGLAATGCQDQRSAGTSTETENAITARSFPLDSLLPDTCDPVDEPVVATLRLDSARFDFSKSRSDARDLELRDGEGRFLPFTVSFWDPAVSKGLLRVRIDPVSRAPNAVVTLRSGLAAATRASDSAVWAGIPDSRRLAWNSVLVDDFEGGSLLRSRLPDSSFWFLGGSITGSGLALSVSGRTGSSLHLTCLPGQCETGRGLLAATLLATSFRDLRALDSIEFWARGNGRLWLAFEHLDSVQMGRMSRGQIDSIEARRAWAYRTLDTTWRRWTIPVADLEPSDGVDGNVGWVALRGAVNYFTIHLDGGSELWIDDIRLHGIESRDLR